MALKSLEILLGGSDDDIKIVMDEFNLTEDIMEESVEKIKSWVKIQPHLCNIKLEDRVVKRFLLCSNFHMERAKEKLENLCTAKAQIPELFSNRDTSNPEIMQGLDVVDWCTMPMKTPENYRISIFGFNGPNADLFNVNMVLKIGFMIAELRLKHDTHSGDVFIFDCSNVTLMHVLKLSPVIKQSIFIIQECYGSKIKGIHILNCPNYAHSAISILRSVLKEKIAKRIFIHKTIDDLTTIIPIDLLPEDLGGKQKSRYIISKEWKSAMTSNEWREWFLETGKNMADLTKKPVNTKIIKDSYLGIQGSFRTLSVD